jgi:UDP-N-acetylglucosamine 1-carboxyvinyltransferase
MARSSRSHKGDGERPEGERPLEKFVITGGRPVCGAIVPTGSKNEALPVVAACLLTREPVTLRNVPEIEDVMVMFAIIEAMGGVVEKLEDSVFRVETGDIENWRLDEEMCRQVRASILFMGPLLARLGRVELPPPGGDVIGRRRLDTHFYGMRSLGADVTIGRTYFLKAERLKGTDLFLDEASVTGTENILMAAALARGSTIIRNAACEPHVQGLARMLNSMGAKIEGIGTNQLVVTGVTELGGTDYRIGADYLEIGSFIGMAAATGGELRISDVKSEDMRNILLNYRKLGIETYFEEENVLAVPGRQELKIQKEMHGAIPKIDDAPWPQFPTDLMSIAIVVATQARGTILFFEKMFDGRMFFVDRIISMGATIIPCDMHRVVVVGPNKLYAGRMESPDIRAGMALLIAGLCAHGETHIHNIRQIDRGYQQIDARLREIGADIQRVPLS